MSSQPKEIAGAVHAYIKQTSSDLYVYSGAFRTTSVDEFLEAVVGKPKRSKRCAVLVTTYGGDLHASYRLIRCLRSVYGHVTLLVVGPCKSAGTLVAVGAHEVAFGETGELGPLDVQMTKPDEIVPMSSGLDAFQALAILTTHAFSSFESYLLEITNRSVGSVSTKTASHMASELVTGLFQPIAAQIDPLRLGEAQRAITIAKAYGERLGAVNLKPNALDTLVEGYPSHGFVIDMDEAKRLFKTVRHLTSEEHAIFSHLKRYVRYPSQEFVGFDAGAMFAKESDHEDQAPSGGTQNPQAHDRAKPGKPRTAPEGARKPETAA